MDWFAAASPDSDSSLFQALGCSLCLLSHAEVPGRCAGRGISLPTVPTRTWEETELHYLWEASRNGVVEGGGGDGDTVSRAVLPPWAPCQLCTGGVKISPLFCKQDLLLPAMERKKITVTNDNVVVFLLRTWKLYYSTVKQTTSFASNEWSFSSKSNNCR